MYSVIAQQLQTNLAVSTWLNGRGEKMNVGDPQSIELDEEDQDGEELDPPSCTNFAVVNVNSTTLNYGEAGNENVSFYTTKDHSKWAVSFKPTEHAGQTSESTKQI